MEVMWLLVGAGLAGWYVLHSASMAKRVATVHEVQAALAESLGIVWEHEAKPVVVRGHRLWILRLGGQFPSVVVEPRHHVAHNIRFFIRLGEAGFDQLNRSHRVMRTGDRLFDGLFTFVGDPLHVTAFATAPIRRYLLTLRCHWDGRRLAMLWSDAGIQINMDRIRTLLELADVMANAHASRSESLTRMVRSDPNPDVRAYVLAEWFYQKPQEAAEVIPHALQDPELSVRCVAMASIPPDAYDAPSEPDLLTLALKPGTVYARRAGVRLLGRHGSLRVISELNRLRKDRMLQTEAEGAIAALQQRHGTSEGRLSVVDDPNQGALSEADAGHISLVDRDPKPPPQD